MTSGGNGQITVPPELAAAGSTIRNYSGALEAELTALRPKVEELAGTWQGTAQANYHEYQALWDTSADGLFGTHGVLTRIGITTDVVNQNYFDTEAANTKSWLHQR